MKNKNKQESKLVSGRRFIRFCAVAEKNICINTNVHWKRALPRNNNNNNNSNNNEGHKKLSRNGFYHSWGYGLRTTDYGVVVQNTNSLDSTEWEKSQRRTRLRIDVKGGTVIISWFQTVRNTGRICTFGVSRQHLQNSSTSFDKLVQWRLHTESL